jgi:ribosome-binding factor A
MTRRSERVSAALTRAIQEVVARGFSDPRIRGLITVTDVAVSPDFAEAWVSVSVLPVQNQDLTLHGLQAASSHIRHEIGELIDLKRMPKLMFRVDNRVKKEAAVLHDINRAIEASRQASDHPGTWSPAPRADGQQSDPGPSQPDPRKEPGA